MLTMFRLKMIRLAQLCILACLVSLPDISLADIIEARMPNGYLATAEYREVSGNTPTIIVVHGFLATRNFQTVSRLSNALFDEGYSVLAPTLSLSVDKRKTSLPCEAIHTHTLDNDTQEIEYWVNWLTSKGKKNIVLIGHSYGSINILSYALKNRKTPVKKLVATSLVVDEHSLGKKLVSKQIQSARSKIKKGRKDLEEYRLSYCKRYISPPDAYLSYASWSIPKVLQALKTVKIPIHVILGANDTRLSKQWPVTLKKNGVDLTLVDGANHFFDAEHEFDLLENVLRSIQ